MIALARKLNLSRKSVSKIGLAAFAVVARSMQQVAQLVITLLAARFLLPAEYGVYALAIVFMLLIQLMTYTGFYSFIINSKEPEESLLPTTLWLIMGLSLAASVVIGLLAYPLQWLYDSPDLGLVLLLLIAAQPFASYTAWASAVLLRRRQINANFRIMFAQNVAAMVVGIALLIYWESIFALVAYRWSRVIIGLVLYWAVGARPPNLGWSTKLAKKAAGFSGGLYGARFLTFLSRSSSDLMLGLFFGTHEVGLYRFGNRVASGATDVLSQPLSNFSTTQFGAAARGERDLQKVMNRYAGSFALLIAMVGAGIIVFAREAVSLFFQPAYLDAVLVTFAIAVAKSVGIGAMMFDTTFAAVDRTGFVAKYNVFFLLATVAVVLVTTPFGLSALAWGQAAWALANTAIIFALIHRMTPVDMRRPTMLFAGGLALAAVYGVLVIGARYALDLVVPMDEWMRFLAGFGIAVVLAPVILFIAARLRIFSLEIFAG